MSIVVDDFLTSKHMYQHDFSYFAKHSILMLCTLGAIIVSSNKSWEYNAFVIVMPPLPHWFLYTPHFSSSPFQIQVTCVLYQGLDANLFWMFCNSICGHLGAKRGFLVGTLETKVFSRFSSYSHQTCIGLRSRWQSIFGTLWFHLWSPGGQIFFMCTLLTPDVSTDLFWIHTIHISDQGQHAKEFSVLYSSIFCH